ncbi:DUF6221 family protein [[Kitasatospora] papulosa]|uniref:DUF6221 family protein n=1 Tax=[Kitasatospora] papulosa TaxID=1464011 RepID=UPI003713020F
MTDAVVAFLQARLDDDERVARQAASRERGGASWRLEGASVRAGDGAPVARHTWADEGIHIAHQDPARTLREVEAKRHLLQLYETAAGRMDQAMLDADTAAYQEARTERQALRRALLANATVYADHPDYLPEWRP